MSVVHDDIRHRYNYRCTGCGGSFADCQPLWKGSRKCCPDCDHEKAFPPGRRGLVPEAITFPAVDFDGMKRGAPFPVVNPVAKKKARR